MDKVDVVKHPNAPRRPAREHDEVGGGDVGGGEELCHHGLDVNVAPEMESPCLVAGVAGGIAGVWEVGEEERGEKRERKRERGTERKRDRHGEG